MTSSKPTPRRSCAGFTYLWTLMIVALLGAGLAVAADVYSVTAKRERERELLFVGHEFRAALRSYYHAQMRAGRKEYPATLEELLKDSRFPGIRRHLRRIYNDPVHGGNEWGLVRVGGRIVGIHSLSQEQPLKQDNFELDDTSFRNREKYSEWVFTYPANPLLDEELSGDGVIDEGQPMPPMPENRPGEPL